MTPQWVFFDSPSLNNSKVLDEIRAARLSKRETVALDELLKRIADGRAIPGKDFKPLPAQKLHEVRFRANKRIFRLLYSKEQEETLVLVALVFVGKKAQKLPEHVFKKARQRVRIWQQNHNYHQ